MSWSKPRITPMAPPNKPNRRFWVGSIFSLFIIMLFSLMGLLRDSRYLTSLFFWLTAIIVPLLIGCIALSIRYYVYGLAKERFDIWERESNKINDKWQDWAMSYVNIIDSYWSTPNKLTATKIISDRQNLPLQIGKVLSFNDKLDLEYYFDDLFYNLADALNQLPGEQPILITLYSSPESYRHLDDVIYTTYHRSQINKSFSLVHQMVSRSDIEKIIKLIDNPSPTAQPQLIIINDLLSKGSAFLSALLLAEPKMYAEIGQPKINIKFLRPMATDSISDAIEQMTEMQPAIKDIAQLWCANLDNKQEICIAKTLADHEISPDEINFLDSLVGQQTDLAYWSLISLGTQLVKQQQKNILLATLSQEQYLFSVLVFDN